MAEIALLLIFMLGLILSGLFVKSRNQVQVSDPIALPGSGLSVCLPTNPGWIVRESNWRYESDSSIVLVAQRQLSGSRDMSIRWRYVLCSPADTARQILLGRLQESATQSEKMNSVSGPIPIEYAVIQPEQTDEAVRYLAVAALDFGRHLELEIYTLQRFDPFYPEQLLRSLAAEIVYQPPKELQAGKQSVKDFWMQVADDHIRLSDQAFLIKDTQNTPAGYAVFRYSDAGLNNEMQLQLRHQFYDPVRERRESTFWFDGNPKRFRWISTIRRPRTQTPRDYSITRREDGSINVQSNSGDNKQFLCHGLLPELLLAEYAAFFLESEHDSVIVDVLAAQGFVVPTIFQRLDTQNASAQSAQLAFAAKTIFLHSPDTFDEFYFDLDRRFIGRLEHQPLLRRLWETSTVDQLEQIFGDNYQPFGDGVAALHE